MTNRQIKQIEGTVTEALPNAMFRVRPDGELPEGFRDQVEDEGELLAYLAGRMRKFRIRVLIGDRVVVELDPYGGKGRIVRRR